MIWWLLATLTAWMNYVPPENQLAKHFHNLFFHKIFNYEKYKQTIKKTHKRQVRHDVINMLAWYKNSLLHGTKMILDVWGREGSKKTRNSPKSPPELSHTKGPNAIYSRNQNICSSALGLERWGYHLHLHAGEGHNKIIAQQWGHSNEICRTAVSVLSLYLSHSDTRALWHLTPLPCRAGNFLHACVWESCLLRHTL